MKAMLASALGATLKVNGTRVPTVLIERNGFLERLKSIWVQDARVLIICGDPRNHQQNDSLCHDLEESFHMSGLSVSYIAICDDRNPESAANLDNIDVIILTGGHVPTQNRFLKQIELRDRLKNYKGIVVSWSAGSINCADTVYAGPEFEGEAIDPNYERWITGLGITGINIFPHFQKLKDDYLDGMRLIEDITFADSIGHEIIALNDGSYIMINEGKTTLYGEAYMIKDGKQTQICTEGECISLSQMYHSYVMGIDSSIMELENQGFDIQNDGGNFMVSFPKEKSDVWEEFIKQHLEFEYWNEYLAEDKVVFLFHLEEGIKRYEVNNYENDEVLALCEKLCECKFESIRAMLVGNHFYKKVLE